MPLLPLNDQNSAGLLTPTPGSCPRGLRGRVALPSLVRSFFFCNQAHETDPSPQRASERLRPRHSVTRSTYDTKGCTAQSRYRRSTTPPTEWGEWEAWRFRGAVQNPGGKRSDWATRQASGCLLNQWLTPAEGTFIPTLTSK